MAGLHGEYRRKLNRGRVNVPADFRRRLPEELVIFESLGGDCLWLMGAKDLDAWLTELFEARFDAYNPSSRMHLTLRAMLLGKAQPCKIGQSGGLGIPAELRRRLKLGESVVFVGVSDHVEIWDRASWEQASDDDKTPAVDAGAPMKATCEKVNLVVDGASVSSCTLVIADNDDPKHDCRPFAIIENVLTLPEHRRKGYAKEMLGAAIGKARAAGCYKVMLATGSSKEYVHNLYKSLGFDGDAKTCYTMPLE